MQPETIAIRSQGAVLPKSFLLAALVTFPFLAHAQWTAFNDEYKGPGDNSNVSFYSPGALAGPTNGPLSNIVSGAALPVTLRITNTPGLSASGPMGVPLAGTPAYDIFNSYVDWTTGGGTNTGPNGTHIYSTNVVGYVFSGLNPTKVYKFTGTAVRGGDLFNTTTPYYKRWTRVELLGALSYTPNHSPGVLTSNQVATFGFPSDLVTNQVAFNSGLNITNLGGSETGDVIEWTNIAPSLSGTFTVQVRRYTNHISPTDYATNQPAYTLTQIRLEEVGYGVTNLTITLNTPTNGANYSPCTIVSATTTITGPPTNVSYLVDNVVIANRTVTPFSPITLPSLALGSHSIYAVAQNALGVNFYSRTNTFTASQNQGPSVAITNTFGLGVTNGPGKAFMVGTCITNQLSLVDSDGSVTNVDWYENGVKKESVGGTDNMSVILVNDALAGTNVLTAVARDNCGISQTSAPVTLVVTNPASVIVLVPNGSVWKYYAASNPPPADALGKYWFQASYDDSTWTNSGPGFLGYGSKPGENLPANYTTYPERTTINIGPVNGRYKTIYFRSAFNVASPSSYTNLIVRLLRDDGAVVWLNGRPIMTNCITVTNDLTAGTNDLQFSTIFASQNPNDNGTAYYSITNPISGQLVAGNNVLGVEVHQSSVTSHDLMFDLMLWAQGTEGPRLTILNNNNGTATISWSPAGGTLQESSDLRSWNNSSNQNNPSTRTISGNLFFRVH